MAQITIKINTKAEGKVILMKVYDADKTAVFSPDGECVYGSVLTATIKEFKSYEVEIYSSFYMESSLLRMFNN